MRNLLCLLVGLALIPELAGLAIAAPSVDGRDYATVATGHVVAQRGKRFCDGFGGVWDIAIQKGTHAISGTYTTVNGCIGTITGQKTGRKLDMTATGLSPCQCHNWNHTVVTKIKHPPSYQYWEGTTHLGGGNSEDCDDICCIYNVILRCKDMP